jgi:hypothetical protein
MLTTLLVFMSGSEPLPRHLESSRTGAMSLATRLVLVETKKTYIQSLQDINLAFVDCIVHY